MARLLAPSSSKQVNEDRIGVSRQFAMQHRVILVLKGARTVIAEPRGQVAICPTGNPGMASAGMGDVLTGMIAGLLAQGLSAWDAARAGVYLHGLAGDLAAATIGEPGLIAGDVITAIPHALNHTLAR
jgi:NAD(P)H-hydrate epimerase